VRAVDADASDQVWYTQASYLQPSALFLSDAAAGPAGVPSASGSPSGSASGSSSASGKAGVTMLKSLPSQFSSAGLEERQCVAVSRDGTEIPYFVVCRADLKLDGSTPTLLYGYVD
jgi:prolyl oligopeptidase